MVTDTVLSYFVRNGFSVKGKRKGPRTEPLETFYFRVEEFMSPTDTCVLLVRFLGYEPFEHSAADIKYV